MVLPFQEGGHVARRQIGERVDSVSNPDGNPLRGSAKAAEEVWITLLFDRVCLVFDRSKRCKEVGRWDWSIKEQIDPQEAGKVFLDQDVIWDDSCAVPGCWRRNR